MNFHLHPRYHRILLALAVGPLLTHCGKSPSEKALSQAQEMVKESMRQSEIATRKREADDAKQRTEETVRRAKQEAEASARKVVEESRVAAENAAKLAEQQAQQIEKERKLKEQEAELAVLRVRFSEEAQTQFGTVDLDPKIEFSAALKSDDVRMELRGPLLAKLRRLLAAKDWMALLKEMGSDSTNSRTGIPYGGQLGQAVERLLDTAIPMVVKLPAITGDSSPSNGYHLLSLRTFTAVDISKPHPDGGAYVVQWKPKMGDCIIFKGRVPTGAGQFWGGNIWTTAMDQEKERLEKKKELGEVDEAGIDRALDMKRTAIVTQLRQWAGATADGDANPLQEAATAFTQKQWPRLAALLRAAAGKPGADPRVAQAATLIESVVADLKEIEAIPSRIKAANDEYARLNLEAAKPQSEAQSDVLSKKATQVRDSVDGLRPHSTKLMIKATESVRAAEILLHTLVAF